MVIPIPTRRANHHHRRRPPLVGLNRWSWASRANR